MKQNSNIGNILYVFQSIKSLSIDFIFCLFTNLYIHMGLFLRKKLTFLCYMSQKNKNCSILWDVRDELRNFVQYKIISKTKIIPVTNY